MIEKGIHNACSALQFVQRPPHMKRLSMQKRDDMQDSVTNLGQWSTVFFAEQQDAAHALVDKIKKASEENPETFKAAVSIF